MTPRIHPGDGDPRHGTSNGYANLGCRCDPCRAAATAYARGKAFSSYRKTPCPECGGPKQAHAALCKPCQVASVRAACGTESGYRAGCHCEACRAAAAAARRARRHANLEAARAYDREWRRARARAAS